MISWKETASSSHKDSSTVAAVSDRERAAHVCILKIKKIYRFFKEICIVIPVQTAIITVDNVRRRT